LAVLGFVAANLYVVWNVTNTMVTSKGERLLLFNTSLCSTLLFSVFVIVGPLAEAFRTTVEATARLSRIKE